MLIDLKLAGKTVMVVGGGAEAYRKIQNFLDTGAKIWLMSREISPDIQKLGEQKKIITLQTGIKNAQAFVNGLSPKPDILLAITNDGELNSALVKAAKQYNCMVYAVDNPALSDFILPAVAQIGDVKVAISTGGKSPAMAHVLRERIEKLVTPEDLLEIKLQEKIRTDLKGVVEDPKERSKMLYDIINSVEIKEALSQGKITEAEELAMKLIENREVKQQ